jgi:hypothetical protein
MMLAPVLPTPQPPIRSTLVPASGSPASTPPAGFKGGVFLSKWKSSSAYKGQETAVPIVTQFQSNLQPGVYLSKWKAQSPFAGSESVTPLQVFGQRVASPYATGERASLIGAAPFGVPGETGAGFGGGFRGMEDGFVGEPRGMSYTPSSRILAPPVSPGPFLKAYEPGLEESRLPEARRAEEDAPAGGWTFLSAEVDASRSRAARLGVETTQVRGDNAVRGLSNAGFRGFVSGL